MVSDTAYVPFKTGVLPTITSAYCKLVIVRVFVVVELIIPPTHAQLVKVIVSEDVVVTVVTTLSFVGAIRVVGKLSNRQLLNVTFLQVDKFTTAVVPATKRTKTLSVMLLPEYEDVIANDVRPPLLTPKHAQFVMLTLPAMFVRTIPTETAESRKVIDVPALLTRYQAQHAYRTLIEPPLVVSIS